ncbi:uncharacterized protein LOC119386351 [Rhipicephalus sanguineus]|uniref:uncharacterized protein LOC119386351 n=1 Tax=Rhipicephalus sanguineus TaxID=34632 RepID=UPI001893AB12|nr:uncharacterized protein LOC119386351 [Rhipicephalus sanguineus]
MAASAASLYARLVAGLLLIYAIAVARPTTRTEHTSLLELKKHQFVLPISRAAATAAHNQSGDLLNINGSLVGVNDSRLPAMLLSLYDNMSRLILEEQDAKQRAALHDSLQEAMFENMENLVLPGMSVKKRAKLRKLVYSSVTDRFYVAQRFVLVGIIVVVVAVSLIVFVYWFVAYVIRGAMRRSPSDIGITELEDLDIYSTDDDGSSAGRYKRAKMKMSLTDPKIILSPRNALLGYRTLP